MIQYRPQSLAIAPEVIPQASTARVEIEAGSSEKVAGKIRFESANGQWRLASLQSPD